MDVYFGIRSTGDDIHIGHILSLFNMFNFIKCNKVNNIYILVADIHAEISNLPRYKIEYNSKTLSCKILALLKSYIIFNNLPIEYINNIKIIYQYNYEMYSSILTYKLFNYINVSKLLKNPIFKQGIHKTVSFLCYPILQSIDVLLCNDNNVEMNVFVSKDQNSNINIMKDIYDKLNIVNINFKIYENIVYSIDGKTKMSKSLNNITTFSDFKKFIINYTTNQNDCMLYKNIMSIFLSSLNIENHNIKTNCNRCFDCKNEFIDLIFDYINLYNSFINDKIEDINIVSNNLISNNYKYLYNKINNLRK